MTLKSEMKVHKRLIAEMLSDPKNAREHPEPNLKAVEDSLRQFGQVEPIVVTAVGSLPIRAGRQFQGGRKLGKTHQNVLVFVKGDAKKATEAIGDVEFAEVDQASEDAG